MRYLWGRVDVVTIRVRADMMHEMLCRADAARFDNRMLQVKKQLREKAATIVRSFPLLYSKLI